jgi:hypothetical protein
MADVAYGLTSLTAAFFGNTYIRKGYLGTTLLFVSNIEVLDGGYSSDNISNVVYAGNASVTYTDIITAGGA